MSDSKEKSDDLIAELAKLMASNAQGAESDPKQTVIKLPPLSEATVPAPGPVRIPGMDTPRPAAAEAKPATPVAPASAAPTVRIPGMDRPAGVSEPPAAAQPQRPAAPLDLGKAPAAMPAIKSEPLANWQEHRPSAAPQAAPPEEPRVQPAAPPPSPPVSVALSPSAAPAPAAAQAAALPQAPSAPRPSQPEQSGSSFDFDFGFGTRGDDPQGATPPAGDPIADLIAAELDAAESAPGHGREPSGHERQVTAPMPLPAATKPVSPAPGRAAALAAPVKPVSVTPRASEGDRFAIAPVFGGTSEGPREPQFSAPVTTSQSPPAMSARQREELDPIEEIESLIGEAVRVELATPEKPAPRPQAAQPAPAAPVVPPLGTSFAPRRAGITDNGSNHAQSAEDAILAAAAASGAEVERIEPPEADDRPYKRMKVKPPRTSFVPSGARQYVGIAVAGTLLLAAGFGLYWVLGMSGGGDPATAPVLTADASPAKVEPVVTPTTGDEASSSIVFDEIDGGTGDDVETLVSRDETAGASAAEVARTVTPVVEDVAETGLANRKVRTVTVRPDGTIVAADDALAGTEALPVERPNVPEIEGEGIEPSELLTAAVAESEAGGVVPVAAETTVDPIAALVDGSVEATTTPLAEPAPLEVAAVDTADTVQPVFDGSLTPPIPMPRPGDRDNLVGSGSSAALTPAAVSVNEPASTPLVAVTQGATPAAAAPTPSGAYAQIASLPTESDAQSQVRAQTSRFGSLFNGTSLEVRRVDLGAKGVWYRVVLPVGSFQEATQICATIKANGGDCIPNSG